MMNRRSFLGSLGGAALAPAAQQRPNIVVMMADDMGFSDLGCYGGEIATPNIDSMARRGIRFTQFYNTARCCPTRATLLSGLYAHQAGIGHMMEDRKLPGYRGDLSRNCVTIAEVMRTAGYRTAMSGKWHVTPVNGSKHNWPLQRGFEKFFGTIHGAGSFYDPVSLARDNTPVEPDSPDFYYTDAIADNAVNYIGEFAAKPDPFFVYVPFTSPHWPMHALEADIAKYRGRYKDGWDALRAERHARQIRMGLVDKRWPLTPRDAKVPAWKDAPDKEWEQRRMEVYAAMIDRMDQGVGRILRKLRETGVEDRTLVLMLADNGGCAEILNPGAKALHIPARTRAGAAVRAGNDPAIMPGGPGTYQSYGIGWANASNTPFRLYKHWVHEGGISSPLIAQWPGKIRKGGKITHEAGHLIDIMATCADVGGARYPEQFNGAPITPLEGRSLVPAFGGARHSRRETYWEHEGNRAVRVDHWKLVSKHPGGWELYDLRADRCETRDLAQRFPERAAGMAAKWEAWAKRANVEPWEKVQKS